MIRLFLYDSTWFNVDNDTDAQNLLDKGAVEYTSDQIRGVEGNETWVSNDTMFQDENGEWYFYREEPVIERYQEEIATLKKQLFATDYKAIKYAEGVMTDEEYQETGIQRQVWRARINELEELING